MRKRGGGESGRAGGLSPKEKGACWKQAHTDRSGQAVGSASRGAHGAHRADLTHYLGPLGMG